MEILVDDRPYAINGSETSTVGDLAQEVCRSGDQNGHRLVVRMCCDGREVPQNDLEDVLATPLEQFSRLEMHTQPLSSLLATTIDQAIDMFNEADDLRGHIADLLSEGQQNESMEQLQKFLTVWRQVQDTLLVATQAMNIDLDTLTINEMGIGQILEMIKNQLNEMKEAMMSGDYVVVSDILRYEFDEPFEHWRTLLEELRSQAEQMA